MHNSIDPLQAEIAVHAILRLIADRPGTAGRLRTARIVTGRPVSAVGETAAADFGPYAAVTQLSLKDTVQLIDSLVLAGLVTSTVGRPLLVLTRSGHRALDALEASTGGGSEWAAHERILHEDDYRSPDGILPLM